MIMLLLLFISSGIGGRIGSWVFGKAEKGLGIKILGYRMAWDS
jgi:hypothetical protein